MISYVDQGCTFDLLIRNVRIANVFTDTLKPGSIGICGDEIKYIGEPEGSYRAVRTIDGKGLFALPGFIDSHMHLESSMLSPAEFARCALANGTTTVCPDPHEVCNVMGADGVVALMKAAEGLPLKVLMMAPSTVPSAPGYEGSGAEVGPDTVEELLSRPGILGLGEVMDFNGVADGEAHILSVVEAAKRAGVIIDGHASLLTGDRLQRFLAAGIDSDHTAMTPEKFLELLSLGFTVQIQESALSRGMAEAMNSVPISNRVCLVTDDVSLDRLMHNGHLNHVVSLAVELGLDPMRAVRFATINPADRLRQYHTGAIAPGRIADIQLVQDIRRPKPELLIASGKVVYEDGHVLPFAGSQSLDALKNHPMLVNEVTAQDFECPVAAVPGSSVEVNIIHQDGISSRTKRALAVLPAVPGSRGARLDTDGYMKMAVFNRYGLDRHGLALVDGFEGFSGAVALTYGHDAHNLMVYGTDDDDMAAAANEVRRLRGGICAVQHGELLAAVPLPLAGLMSEESAETLLDQMDAFLAACARMGFSHKRPLPFFTQMALAVSPEIKCTDLGLIDVVNKRLLPLVERVLD